MDVEKLLEWMRGKGVQLTVTQSDLTSLVRLQLDTGLSRRPSIRKEKFIPVTRIERANFSAMTDALEQLMEETEIQLQEERNREEENQSKINAEKAC